MRLGDPLYNCVIDGDTFYFEGKKIRVADIDAPETNSPRCAGERELGARATRRLHELLNAGRFELVQLGSRNIDRYGRELRVVTPRRQVAWGHFGIGRAGTNPDRPPSVLVHLIARTNS